MDDPMTIIARHHKAKLDTVMLIKAASQLSGVIGGYTASDGNDAADNLILTWLDEEQELVTAQLSRYGVFVGHVKQVQFFQIVGFCCLYGIPFFTEDDIFELTEKEAPEQSTQTH